MARCDVSTAVSAQKPEVLLKLLRLGPESLPELIRCTGWGEAETKAALDALLLAKKVSKRHAHRGSLPVFQVLDSDARR